MRTWIIFHFFFELISSKVKGIPLTVNSNVGKIMGFTDNVTVEGKHYTVSKFLSIPYAESPTGKNRFLKPIPKAPFQDVFDARNQPMACYQYTEAYMEQMRPFVPGFSEDCLTLNIYVPHDMGSNDLLPVMVWIHGGSFVVGAASEYQPEVLSTFGHVIVVTINYRLGMFGFLKDESRVFPGNQGLWDQHLALKWIRNNIESFKGLKDEITIFGESAGGAAVLYQALYPGNRNLFKRVIAESGSPLATWAFTSPSFSKQYLEKMGCQGTSNTLECMQAKTPHELINTTILLLPVMDGEFIKESPLQILSGNNSRSSDARDFYGSLDILSGVNNYDGANIFEQMISYLGTDNVDVNITRKSFVDVVVPMLYPKDIQNSYKDIYKKLMTFAYTTWDDPDNYKEIRDNIVNMSNDAKFFAPAVTSANTHAAFGKGTTYFYEFAADPHIHNGRLPSLFNGSIHADELQFVFGVPLQESSVMFGQELGNFTNEEKLVSKLVMAAWSNFAKSGNPNFPMNLTQYSQVQWPPYDTTTQQYLEITNQMSSSSVREKFHPRRIRFWQTVVYPLLLHMRGEDPTQEIIYVDPVLVG